MRTVLTTLSSTTLVALMGGALPSPAAAQERRVDVRRVVRAIVDATVVAEIAAEIQVAAGAGQQRETRYPFQRDERISRTLSLGPDGSLDLRNLSGRITVTGGSGRDVTLEIVRVSRGRTEDDAARGLEDVATEISHQGSRASAETRYPTQERGRDRGYSVSVTYDVTAPVGTSLSIHNLSGDVAIKNLTGDIAVDLASGDVTIAQASRLSQVKVLSGDLTLTDIKGTAPIDASTMSGNARIERVQVPRLAVTTISGDVVAADVTSENVSLKTTSGSIDFAGPLARSGRYELLSHSGNVSLTVVGNTGFELTARTFSGSVQPDASLGLKTRTANRREVRGTAGDGSATVQATTFSGNVVIARK